MTALAQRYRDAGLTDVTVRLHPGARHEVVDETNRDEVTGDVAGRLVAHLPHWQCPPTRPTDGTSSPARVEPGTSRTAPRRDPA